MTTSTHASLETLSRLNAHDSYIYCDERNGETVGIWQDEQTWGWCRAPLGIVDDLDCYDAESFGSEAAAIAQWAKDNVLDIDEFGTEDEAKEG